MTPQQHANAIAGVGDGLMRGAVQQLERATAEAVRERNALAGMIGTMNGRRQQLTWLLGAGFGALVLGVLISPVFVRLLPFGWDGQVAAFIMRGDRWHAGADLMAAGSPAAWRDMEAAAELIQSNKAALAACWEAGTKTKKDQRCSIVVPTLP